MSTTSISAEFTLPEEYSVNRSGPKRWLVSHTLRYWPLGIILIGGAVSNAALAAVVPILIGQAFNLILGASANINALLRISLIIAGTQVLRSVLQFGRNFSAELFGQRLERDIREEVICQLIREEHDFPQSPACWRHHGPRNQRCA